MNILAAVSTKDLAAELSRRKRLRVLSTETQFFNELSEDERYMEYMDGELVRKLSEGINNKMCVMFIDTVIARDEHDRPIRTTRNASIVVLIPDGVDDDSGEDR
jgi:hypothetical protein